MQTGSFCHPAVRRVVFTVSAEEETQEKRDDREDEEGG
jgi:hypothetical protein